MKQVYWIMAALLVCGAAIAAQDTSLTEREIRDPKQLEPWLEANAADVESRLAAVEATTGVTAVVAGTLTVGGVSTFSSNVVVGGSVTAISQDDATTNVIVTTAAAIDGEYIAADTIDDDSIDFSDVTGADLTLTDCGSVSVSALTLRGTGTNQISTAAGEIDGEKIADDTIDDDSIDFSDVTGADLTLTDCDAVTASGAVYGGTVGFSAATGYFAIVDTTQLVFVAESGATTNVIDADITTAE